MDSMNCPVDVIALCRANGEITPLRVRGKRLDADFRGEILEVVKTRRMGYVGSEAIVYVCWAKIAGTRELLELKYHIASASWNLICGLY